MTATWREEGEAATADYIACAGTSKTWFALTSAVLSARVRGLLFDVALAPVFFPRRRVEGPLSSLLQNSGHLVVSNLCLQHDVPVVGGGRPPRSTRRTRSATEHTLSTPSPYGKPPLRLKPHQQAERGALGRGEEVRSRTVVANWPQSSSEALGERCGGDSPAADTGAGATAARATTTATKATANGGEAAVWERPYRSRSRCGSATRGGPRPRP